MLKKSRLLPCGIFLVGFSLAPNVQAEEVPANFVWCDCICGNYSPLEYVCVVNVSEKKISHHLEKIAPLSLRVGASISFRSACENPAVCEPADVFPWKPQASQMPFKGFVAVKLQENQPFGPIPVGTTIRLRGSAYEPLWHTLFLADPLRPDGLGLK